MSLQKIGLTFFFEKNNFLLWPESIAPPRNCIAGVIFHAMQNKYSQAQLGSCLEGLEGKSIFTVKVLGPRFTSSDPSQAFPMFWYLKCIKLRSESTIFSSLKTSVSVGFQSSELSNKIIIINCLIKRFIFYRLIIEKQITKNSNQVTLQLSFKE